MERIFERAAFWGLETEYRDAFGKIQAVEPEVLGRFLELFPVQAPSSKCLAPSIVLRRGRQSVVQLNATAGSPVEWAVLSERECIASGQGASPSLTLPPGLPDGIFRLKVVVATSSGSIQEEARLVVCPGRTYQGGSHAPRRMWALAVQLYAVRSKRNWGHGDFGDLATLIGLAADVGASAVALNPVHTLFDDNAEQASPYSPSSRLFLNPLYVDLDSVPEFPGVQAAGLSATIESLRAQAIVDYRGVAGAKRKASHLAYGAFLQSASAERRRAFERFREERGDPLARFASFEVLRRKFKAPWQDWAEEWRCPDDAALTRLRASEPDVEYYEFVQWLAHEQLETCRARAADHGLPIGLYLDVAVGVRSDGFDAWSDQQAFLTGASIGAPPDVLNTKGQNWGLASINPLGLQNDSFRSFCRVLEASMRYAGAIRLDHVLGLNRIYVIPKGLEPTQGAYLRFPFKALLAVTTLLSGQHKCIVIGEDLGTVPDNFRETLADWGLWSYQVMMFERGWDGAFVSPDHYRENALVSFATHDLPTFAGWMERRDLTTKMTLGLNPGESVDERRNAIDALRRALDQRGLTELDFGSVVRYLADTPSRLLVVAIEDVLQLTEQVNLPGTVDEYPNWRRRLPVPLEELWNHAALRDVATVLESAGRHKMIALHSSHDDPI